MAELSSTSFSNSISLNEDSDKSDIATIPKKKLRKGSNIDVSYTHNIFLLLKQINYSFAFQLSMVKSFFFTNSATFKFSSF